MPALDLQSKRGGLHLPRLGLWLDAHRAVRGPEPVFVSHAHSDHIARHREVILSAPTAELMRTRLGGERIEHRLSFGEMRGFNDGEAAFRLTLLPAGHILGSAMAWIEAEGTSLLYTGDFKLRPSLAAEPCETRHADVLVMETTFGRPEYVFPPAEEVVGNLVAFCQASLAAGATPLLLAYSLGKSQELLCQLGAAGLPVHLHPQAHKLTQVYARCGQALPPWEAFRAEAARGQVLICPPNLARAPELDALGAVRTAVVTGWALNPACRFQYGVDAAFPLSDHADFPDLLRLVELVAPRQVLTVHGFAADFARTLRERGYDARALGLQEQLDLGLRVEVRPKTRPRRRPPVAPPAGANSAGA